MHKFTQKCIFRLGSLAKFVTNLSVPLVLPRGVIHIISNAPF